MFKSFFCALMGASVGLVALGLGQGSNVNVLDDYCDYIEDLPNPYLSELDTVDGEQDNVLASYRDTKSFYFDCLTNNFGMNYKGSCGYVAIGMLLSYYDTFLNDSIIPEQYDENSIDYGVDLKERNNNPGIMHDTMENGNTMSNQNYLNHVQSMSDFSFHGMLISLGNELGYYNMASANPCGTNFGSRLDVLNNYFQNTLNLRNNIDYNFTYMNEENNSSKSGDVRRFTIDLVKRGYPVLLSVRSGRGGHVVVAYDYDEATDSLYCHMGWSRTTTHVTVESQDFNVYRAALAIDFNISHSDSNNFGCTANGKTLFYSGDEIDDEYHLVHKHKYCDHYTHNLEQHCAYCACGEHITENHSYGDHYSRYNKRQHKAYCECGAYVLSPHVAKKTAVGALRAMRYAVCEDCGELIDLGTTPIIAYL